VSSRGKCPRAPARAVRFVEDLRHDHAAAEEAEKGMGTLHVAL